MTYPTFAPYTPDAGRYDGRMPYRRVGASGLQLPAISLGLWHNFGDTVPFDRQRAILRRAFDLGVTHFDLANNYGVPRGSAEVNFGRHLQESFAQHRDELIVSTKAGWDMWPGPYGDLGSRKYLLSSLDQSLSRMGLDYVDIFYSHRFDPATPLEETIGALDTAVWSGKALYAGISSYDAAMTDRAYAIARALGTPLLIHQPSYSILNRWVERPIAVPQGDGNSKQESLLDVLARDELGCICFSPLSQGLLTNRYLDGIPEGSRAATADSFLPKDQVTETLPRVRALNAIARQRGQTLAQMAIAWILRDARVTSALVGASSVEQLEDTLGCLAHLDFSPEELAAIDAA